MTLGRRAHAPLIRRRFIDVDTVITGLGGWSRSRAVRVLRPRAATGMTFGQVLQLANLLSRLAFRNLHLYKPGITHADAWLSAPTMGQKGRPVAQMGSRSSAADQPEKIMATS